MHFVDLEKAFDRVPKKVLEWAMRKKEIPEVLVRSVMSQYKGAKTKVRADFEFLEEFEDSVRMQQGSVLSPLLSEVVDVVTEVSKVCALSELLYSNNKVLISKTIK